MSFYTKYNYKIHAIHGYLTYRFSQMETCLIKMSTGLTIYKNYSRDNFRILTMCSICSYHPSICIFLPAFCTVICTLKHTYMYLVHTCTCLLCGPDFFNHENIYTITQKIQRSAMLVSGHSPCFMIRRPEKDLQCQY